MRHHYWELPIFAYLFLGGLGGGIMFLSMIFSNILYPGSDAIVQALWLSNFIAIAAMAVGCFFLIFELGQPFAFFRVWLKSTSIICWGARFLVIAMVFDIVWWVAYVPVEYVAALAFLAPLCNALRVVAPICLIIAGIAGFCIMVYTGVMISTLKAHSFWATPALPILFTVSAISTGCAAIMICAGVHPNGGDPMTLIAAETVREILHVSDIILVLIEITILLVMLLSFLGSGNKVQNAVAHRWIHGSYALGFWGGMICCGLGIPLILNLFGSGAATHVVAPTLVLCGGLLLRALIIFSDDRAEVPGETIYFTRLVDKDADFIHRWVYGKNEF